MIDGEGHRVQGDSRQPRSGGYRPIEQRRRPPRPSQGGNRGIRRVVEQLEGLGDLRLRMAVTERCLRIAAERCGQRQLHALRPGPLAVVRSREVAEVLTVELEVRDVDPIDIGGILQPVLQRGALDADLVVLGEIRGERLIRRQGRIDAGERQGVGAPAPEAFGVRRVYLQIRREVVGSIDLFHDASRPEGRQARAVTVRIGQVGRADRAADEEVARRLGVECLMEEAHAGGSLPFLGNVPGELAESGEILEGGVALVMPVLVRARGVRLVAVGEVLDESRDVLMELNGSALSLVVRTDHVIKSVATVGYQADLLNERMIVGRHLRYRQHPWIEVIWRIDVEIESGVAEKSRSIVRRREAIVIVVRRGRC